MQLPRWLEEKMWIEAAHQIWKRLPGENFLWHGICCTPSLSSQTLVLKHLAMWKVKPCSRSLAWIVTAKSSQAKQFRDSRLSYERKKGNKWDDRADYPALLDRCSCQLRCLQLILMLLNAANTLRNTQWHSFICLQSRRFTAWAWSLDTTCSPPNSVRWVQWWCWRSRWSMVMVVVKLLVAWWLVAGNDNVGGDNKSTTQAGWLERTFAQSRKHSKWQSRYLKKNL